MRRCHVVLLIVFISLSFSISFAQKKTLQRIGSISDAVVYFSPKNGDAFVPTRSTIVIRLAKGVLVDALSSDFSFAVFGELSGIHSGKVVVSDDDRTIIFKPDVQFAINENISVTLACLRDEHFRSFTYNFQTTGMTDEERTQILSEIRQKELEESIPSFQVTSSKIQTLHFIGTA